MTFYVFCLASHVFSNYDGRKSDFLRSVAAVQILIENAERFARIDLDLKKNATNVSYRPLPDELDPSS